VRRRREDEALALVSHLLFALVLSIHLLPSFTIHCLKYGSRVETLTHLQNYIIICQVAVFSKYVLSMVDLVCNPPLYISSPKGVYFSNLDTFVKTGSGCSATTSANPGLRLRL
jgi:hypothetical protein